MKDETFNQGEIHHDFYRPYGSGAPYPVAVNSFFLESFYTNEKLKLLEEVYDKLNEFVVEKAENGENIIDDLQSLYSKDGEQTEASRMLRLMSEKYNITIAIVDSMNDNMVPSYRDGRFLADRVHQYILGKNEPQTETLISEDNYKIQKSYDRRSQGYYLESWGFFDDNRTIFIMSMPLASIHESVDISNNSWPMWVWRPWCSAASLCMGPRNGGIPHPFPGSPFGAYVGTGFRGPLHRQFRG